jgi:hypothetical protein
VEFALVSMPLIWMLGIISEVSAFSVIQYQMQYATARAARLLRTNQLPAAMQVSEFKGVVCEKLAVPKCTQRIHIDVRHASSLAKLNPPSLQSIGPSSQKDSYVDTYDPGSNGDAGSLIVTYDWKFIFPFMGKRFAFGNLAGRTDVRRLYGSSIYMNELK